MKYTIKIKRGSKDKGEQYFQRFVYEGSPDETVSTVLEKLNGDDLFDADGNPAKKIAWSLSCGQGMCGACAMVINKVPALACKTKLKDIKGDCVVLEPLSKFPLLKDLETDRSALYYAPVAHGIWNNGNAEINKKQHNLEYEASKCMKCGICVEVCPSAGISSGNLGAAFAVDCYLKYVQNHEKIDKKKMKKEYGRNFAGNCSKSMSCMDNCPAHIDLKKLITYMNR